MKIVQSYWTKPSKGEDLELGRRIGGWLTERHQYLSLALSCYLLREQYEEVELVTDEDGKRLLIDTLRLPYTHVRVCLNALEAYPAGLWALPKLYTYSLQDKPFIHVDGDVFIWKRFPEYLSGADIVAQSPELDHDEIYRAALEHMHSILPSVPDIFAIDADKQLTSLNAGILGGNNVAFLRRYALTALEYIDQNLDAFQADPKVAVLNIILEQYLLHRMATQEGISISYLTQNLSRAFSELIQFDKVPSFQWYVHLVSAHKKSIYSCEQVELRFRHHFPKVYRQISRTIDRLIFEPVSNLTTSGRQAPSTSSTTEYITVERLLPLLGHQVLQKDEIYLRRLIKLVGLQQSQIIGRFVKEVWQLERIRTRLSTSDISVKRRRRRTITPIFNFLQNCSTVDLLSCPMTMANHVRIVAVGWPIATFEKAFDLADLHSLTNPQEGYAIVQKKEDGSVIQEDLLGFYQLLVYYQDNICTGYELLQEIANSDDSPEKLASCTQQLCDFLTNNLVYNGVLRLANVDKPNPDHSRLSIPSYEATLD